VDLPTEGGPPIGFPFSAKTHIRILQPAVPGLSVAPKCKGYIPGLPITPCPLPQHISLHCVAVEPIKYVSLQSIQRVAIAPSIVQIPTKGGCLALEEWPNSIPLLALTTGHSTK